VLTMLGDRLGLFKALADGPATAPELAARAGVDERYELPAEHAAVLADEGGPYFLGCGAGLALAETAPNLRFETLDASAGLPETYDVISAFDVVHDAADPRALLAAIRAALADDGTFVLLEMRSEDDPAANVGPVATVMYGVSVLYCMTTSLAHDGHGLGTLGLPAAAVRELCRDAGFGRVEPIALEDPFNAFYAVRP
jgi:SAM-dependent methyltransferase